jgi:PTS system N-acetylglucosamine-specific IIC component
MEMRASAGPLAGAATPAAPAATAAKRNVGPWLDALGGRDNVAEAGAASSRLWLRLRQPERLDEPALQKLGVRMVARPTAETVQLLVKDADSIAAALQAA